MTVTSLVVLDHLEEIALEKEDQHRYRFELDAIRYLKEGLTFLALGVHGLEKDIRARVIPEHVNDELHFGCSAELEGIPYGFVASAFHWYAVSACNVVRQVGAISHQLDDTRPTPSQYLNIVLPRIRVFRDKIAAHFAASMSNSNDKPAERTLSVFPPVIFTRHHFVSYPHILVQAEPDTIASSDSSALQSWSLTVAHEELGRRYWSPGGPPIGAT